MKRVCPHGVPVDPEVTGEIDVREPMAFVERWKFQTCERCLVEHPVMVVGALLLHSIQP